MKLSFFLFLVLGTSTALAQPVFTETGQDLRGPFIEPFADSTHSDVAVADIDGDGDLDLLLADDSGGGIERGSVAFFNDGQGFFSASSQRIGDGIAEALSAADFDGDGLPDLVLANTSNNLNTDEVYLNNGTGFFELSQTLSASRARDVVTGDFDGNGSIDILIAAATGTVGGAQNLLYTNNGDGTFAEPTLLSATNPSFGAVSVPAKFSSTRLGPVLAIKMSRSPSPSRSPAAAPKLGLVALSNVGSAKVPSPLLV
ncbi:MAG: VCBS repeat-containing protein [Pseudomonadota bacterium]